MNNIIELITLLGQHPGYTPSAREKELLTLIGKEILENDLLINRLQIALDTAQTGNSLVGRARALRRLAEKK